MKLLALFVVLSLAQAPPLTKAEQLQDASRKGDAAPGQEAALNAAVLEDDKALAKVVLDAGRVPVPRLTDALETARAQKKTEMAALLESAGAKPYAEVKLEPERLARLAGSYKSATGTAEMVLTVLETRLVPTTPGGQKITLVPLDPNTFVMVSMAVTRVYLQTVGDKRT